VDPITPDYKIKLAHGAIRKDDLSDVAGLNGRFGGGPKADT